MALADNLSLEQLNDHFVLLGKAEISGITYCRFDDSPSLLDGLDSNLKLVDVIKRIEDAEDIHAIFLSL